MYTLFRGVVYVAKGSIQHIYLITAGMKGFAQDCNVLQARF